MSRHPLRIHIITEEDPFYLPVFFREFLARVPWDRIEILGIDITPPLNQPTRQALARKLYGFYGGVDFVRLAGRFAIAKALDLLAPRALWSGTIERLAARRRIPCRVVTNVNAPHYVGGLRRSAPDLLVSVAASQIFKPDLLSVAQLGCVNVHTGPLPAYRGMMPVFWQMYDKRKSITVTLHTMTPDVDVGSVLLENEVPLNGDRNLDLVIRKMKREGARTLVELLDRYHAGSVQAVAMNRSQAQYHSFPGRVEADRFRDMGYRLV
jgi:methionyl-tRNA formyltransferase